MQAYSASFARIYALYWGDFARRIGPMLLDYYERSSLGQSEKTLLDVCCGTGDLARLALRRGYRVIGLDASEPMLEQAREKNREHVASERARFVVGDATSFEIDNPVGLATSTYDALNHLEDLASLRRCFRCVFASVRKGGMFAFDLNTRSALTHWTGISIEDTTDLMLVNRALFDPVAERGHIRISGFARREDGLYDRFEETAYNTAFDMDAVRETLLEVGWTRIRLATADDLDRTPEDPEQERRIMFIAYKS